MSNIALKILLYIYHLSKLIFQVKKIRESKSTQETRLATSAPPHEMTRFPPGASPMCTLFFPHSFYLEINLIIKFIKNYVLLIINSTEPNLGFDIDERFMDTLLRK
jgi:hypothetical protein